MTEQELKFMEDLLETSFPSTERRDFGMMRYMMLADRDLFRTNILYDEGEMAGVLNYWDYGSYAYYEHLVTDPSLRCRGLGTRILEEIKSRHRRVFFEVELPREEMSTRRLGFYQRNGARIIDEHYRQPPYFPGQDYFPMLLMGFGEEISREEIEYALMNAYPIHYVEQKILPRYREYDSAHQPDHIRMVIDKSLELARKLIAQGEALDINMVYFIAAYHDLGICEGRELHHLSSGRIMSEDPMLPRWFSPEQIQVMKEAVEDHRASNRKEPRSLYGRIVAEADRTIDPELIIRRCLEYGMGKGLSREEQFARAARHLEEKYGEGGYLKLWFKDTDNHRQLQRLRQLIASPGLLRSAMERIWEKIQ